MANKVYVKQTTKKTSTKCRVVSLTQCNQSHRQLIIRQTQREGRGEGAGGGVRRKRKREGRSRGREKQRERERESERELEKKGEKEQGGGGHGRWGWDTAQAVVPDHTHHCKNRGVLPQC